MVAGKYISQKGYSGLVCPIVLNDRNEVIFEVGKTSDVDNYYSANLTDCTQLFLPGLADKKKNSYSNGWPIVREGLLILKAAPEGGPESASFMALDVRTGRLLSFPALLQPVNNSFAFREGVIAMEIPESKRGDFGDEDMGYYDTANLADGYAIKLLIESQSQRVHPFFNGVAAVEKDDRWIFISRDSTVIGETQLSTREFDAFPPMYFNGLIGFWKNGKAGYVDITGKEVIPFTLDEYHPFEYTVTPVKQNGLFGLMRIDGSWAVAPKFEDLQVGPCPCYH